MNWHECEWNSHDRRWNTHMVFDVLRIQEKRYKDENRKWKKWWNPKETKNELKPWINFFSEDSCPASQNISRFLCNPKVHYCFHKSSRRSSVTWIQSTPLHTWLFHNQNWSLPFRFTDQVFASTSCLSCVQHDPLISFSLIWWP
jgi:hypothetical protein